MNKSAWERLLAGWPVYSAVALFLFLFSQYWIDARISTAIKAQTKAIPVITDMAKSVALTEQAVTTNAASINRVESKVEEVERDTKRILFFLGGGEVGDSE